MNRNGKPEGLSVLLLLRQPDGVPSPAGTAGANGNFFNFEPGRAQALGELFVRVRGPDRQHAAGA